MASRGAIGRRLGVGALVGLAGLAQLVGLCALGMIVSQSDVLFNHGQGASCSWVDLPAAVSGAVDESTDFDQSWSWWPPGLVCRTDVEGRTVTVHEPAWPEMGGWLLALLAAVTTTAVTMALVLQLVDSWWWRHRQPATGLLTVAGQPLVLATAGAALLVPMAV